MKNLIKQLAIIVAVFCAVTSAHADSGTTQTQSEGTLSQPGTESYYPVVSYEWQGQEGQWQQGHHPEDQAVSSDSATATHPASSYQDSQIDKGTIRRQTGTEFSYPSSHSWQDQQNQWQKSQRLR